MNSYFEHDRHFKKSSFSGWQPMCVAVAISPENDVAVRNSSDRNKVTLFFSQDEWSAFIKGVKKGEFDLS